MNFARNKGKYINFIFKLDFYLHFRITFIFENWYYNIFLVHEINLATVKKIANVKETIHGWDLGKGSL